MKECTWTHTYTYVGMMFIGLYTVGKERERSEDLLKIAYPTISRGNSDCNIHRAFFGINHYSSIYDSV